MVRLVAGAPLLGWPSRNSEYDNGTHGKDEHDLRATYMGATQRACGKCCGHNWYVGYSLELWD